MADDDQLNEAKDDIEVAQQVWSADSSPSPASTTPQVPIPPPETGGRGPTEAEEERQREEMGLSRAEYYSRRKAFASKSQPANYMEAAHAADEQATDESTDPAFQRRDLGRKGCSLPLVALATAIAVAGIATAGVLIGTGGSSKPNAVSATASTDASGAPGAGQGAPSGDCSSFAGHWGLQSGLQDPGGQDANADYYAMPNPQPGPSEASFDIDAGCTVTGGILNSEYAEGNDSCKNTSTFRGTSAQGSMTPDGHGTVTFLGQVTMVYNAGGSTEGCGGAAPNYTKTYDGHVTLGFSISGTTMETCNRVATPSPFTCSYPKSGLAGTFTRP